MPSLNNDGIRYIKISRIDKNGVDQTPTLQSLNKITIPYSTGDITYTVINITERLTFFLYYVNLAGVEWDDRAEIKYDFTGSLISRPSSPPEGIPNGDYVDVVIEKDNLNFWERIPLPGYVSSFKNQYGLQTYPQKIISFHATGSISAVVDSIPASNDSHLIVLTGEENGDLVPLDAQSWTPSSTATQSFDLNFSPSITTLVSNTKFSILITKDNDDIRPIKGYNFHGDSLFFISSSNATGQQVGLVAEPYFGSNDFNRALDCQPLLNNAERVRKHNLYQDIDYSAGVNEPVNFDLLISGSATRAEVQFSNYTSQRHIIPRYKGSKSTSQKLNTWTEGDTGTYGKTPTVESLKAVVAYCDFIGGWPPERMNASTAHILYIIDQDGNIGIPNTSENSLSNVQGSFQTGERFRISSETIGSGEATPFRTVIRGGQRIEPILYTQSGSNPGAQWTDIELIDIQTTSGSATSNYQNNGSVLPGTSYTFQQRLKLSTGQPNPSYIGSTGGYNYYDVPSAAVDDGVSLTFHLNQLKIGFFSGIINNTSFRVGVILKINNDSFSVLQEDFNVPYKSSNIKTRTLSNKSFTIPSSQLIAGQQISFEIQVDELQGELGLPGGVDEGVGIQFGSYAITQTPIPTQTISPSTVSNVTDIWGYYDKTNYPYVITSSAGVAASLGALYNDSNVRQKSTEGSGFNPIALPWEIEYGDEFRFEGDERYTYMVKEIYGPNEGSGSRLSQTGSIEVHFNGSLPISASWDNFNLDHFLIRRYVNDASQVIMEGFKPENSSGPFIITPEYVVPKMNKKVDEYITLLTEKGLL
jgi:hypothetical protein